jgi:hypothetical protein
MAQESIKGTGLKGALLAFAASPRYAVLKNLQVGRLLPEECDFHSPLAELTLESLVELGSARIVGSSALTLRQEATLVELLSSLASAEEEIIQPSGELVVSDRPSTTGAESEVSSFGSVQLELMLRQRLEALSSHERYASICRRTLGEYWDARWTPAPFEQALRIEQLAKMDLAVLFKKRTVNDERLYLICCALERALQSLVVPVIDAAISSPESAPAPLSSGIDSPAAHSEAVEWRIADSRLSSPKKAIVELIAIAARHQQDPTLHQLLQAVIRTFSPDEFIQIVFGEELSPELTKRMKQVVEEILRADRWQLLSVLLQGPGVHITAVAHMLSNVGRNEGAVIELLAVLIARAMGAHPVQYKGVVCEVFWTLNVDLIGHMIIEAQKVPKKLPRGQTEPLSSPALDPILLDWVRVQCGLRSSGKRFPRTKRK